MKCISLIQPWATLWVLGVKTVETRSWSTSYRGELFVHASKTLDPKGKDIWTALSVRKHCAWPESKPNYADWSFEELPRGAIIGSVYLKSVAVMTKELIDQQSTVDLFLGDWKPGRFAWFKEMENIGDGMLPVPIDCKGSLGLWDYDPIDAARKRAEDGISRASDDAERRRIYAISRGRRRSSAKKAAIITSAKIIPNPAVPIPRKFNFDL